MKLEKKPNCNIEKIQLPPYFFNNKQTEPVNIAGRRIYEDVIIDFETPIPFEILGLKIEEIEIYPYRMFGVIPIQKMEDNIYKCSIDYFEVKK